MGNHIVAKSKGGLKAIVQNRQDKVKYWAKQMLTLEKEETLETVEAKAEAFINKVKKRYHMRDLEPVKEIRVKLVKKRGVFKKRYITPRLKPDPLNTWVHQEIVDPYLLKSGFFE